MHHAGTVTLPTIDKERKYYYLYIDMVKWSILVHTVDDQVCVYVGPDLHEALLPYTFEVDVAFLNERGNAYKDSSFTTRRTLTLKDVNNRNVLWGKSKWKSVHLLKKQADGSTRVRLKVKSLTSESALSLAVLDTFLKGEAGKWPTQARQECERLQLEIADWERMVQEALAEQEVIKAERASLQALLDDMGTLASDKDPALGNGKRVKRNMDEPAVDTVVEPTVGTTPVSLDALGSAFDAVLSKRSGAALAELEDFLGRCRAKVDTKQKEERTCVVCWAQERSVIMLPCRHQVTCPACADALMASTKTCPACRAAIVETINPFH